jgi:hypothetical protein
MKPRARARSNREDKRVIRRLRRDPDSWAAKLWKLRANTRSSGGVMGPNKTGNISY